MDVSEQVLDSDLFGLDGSDGAFNVFKLHGAGAVFGTDLFDADVGLGGEADVGGGLGFDDHQHGIAAVATKQLVHVNVVGTNARTTAVPSNHTLARIHLAKHGKHLLVKVVVHKPNFRIARVLFERN